MPEETLPQIHIPGVSDQSATPLHTSVVHHVFIMDSSGSMRPLRAATIVGFNEQVQNIRQLEQTMPEQQNRVTLVFFNGRITERLVNTSSDTLRELTEADYDPSGSTNLYGAIGRTLSKVKAELGSRIGTDRVIVTIQTDGENTDTDDQWNQSKTKEFIEQLQADHHWVVTFIGANIDVDHTSRSLGIPVSNAVSYSADLGGTRRMFQATSLARSAYLANTRGMGIGEASVSSFYSPDETRSLDLRGASAVSSSDSSALAGAVDLLHRIAVQRTAASGTAGAPRPTVPPTPVQP